LDDGVFVSEPEWIGRVKPGRGLDGLNKPGDDIGVLFAVRGGNELEEGGIMV
jgi:hypothetical protein